MKTIIKITIFTLLVTTTMLFAALAAQPDTESYDLEVTLFTHYNHDFTMQTTVRTEQPFVLIATNGQITNKVSGILHSPTNGIYLLDFAVSELESEKSNAQDTTMATLELGKVWAGAPVAVSSFLDMRYVLLRKHEPHRTLK